MENYDIQPIPTSYNGVSYKSRLEARWAVFFDVLQIKHYYEYEGFENKKTKFKYLPDFWLPDVYLRSQRGAFIEIKPDEKFFTGEYSNGLMELNKPIVGFSSYPPGELIVHGIGGIELNGGWDEPMIFCECERCGKFKIEYPEGSYSGCPHCKKGSVKFFYSDGDFTNKFRAAVYTAKSFNFYK